MSVSYCIYIFPGSVHIFPCSRIGRPILEIYINLSQIYEGRNWETECYNSVLGITVSYLGIHKWEPAIYIGFSPVLHLQCTMSLTKLSLGGNNDVIYKLFPPRESLVSDILAGDGNVEKLFLRCMQVNVYTSFPIFFLLHFMYKGLVAAATLFIYFVFFIHS